MQNLNAKVDQFYNNVHPEGQDLMNTIRHYILSIDENIEEDMRFKVPFYIKNGLVCYVNYTHPIGEIAFCKGEKLVERGLTLRGDGYAVRKLYFRRGEQPDKSTIQHVLQQAVELNSDLEAEENQ